MITTEIAPRCRCCTNPAPLLPRADLGAGLAVCPRSGRTHRIAGLTFELADDAPLVAAPTANAAPVIKIDLSREGYA